MQRILFLLLLVVIGCNSNKKHKAPPLTKDNPVNMDTFNKQKQFKKAISANSTLSPSRPETYSNERFKEITVKKIGDHKFRIQGKGQIFEAGFSWIIEDGHEELKQGFQMTDAGAPEWGNINFTVDVQKKRGNSTLTLTLFEASAKDGSRQYELPIVLY